MLDRTLSYDALRDGFTWNIPPRLNMAAQVCDDWAARSPARTAIIDMTGARRRDVSYGTLREMAEQLATSPRTLKRHLQQADLTYRQLQDEARYRQACKLLGERGTRISEVAYALGYNDVANFSRAFKRWSGKTPREYREGI